MSSLTNRRHFLKSAALGATALSMSARSYARVVGANDRMAIGVIGCGSRGLGAHMQGINAHAKAENVEIIAVCDPWRPRREAAAAQCKEWYGIDARQFVSYRDLLTMEELDAVTIASCDHQHTTHLKAAAEAGKDVYVEKPLGMNLDEVNAACDAVKASGAVVQVGTQLRSLGSMAGARELYRTGIVGKTSRIEQCRNAWQPYWYGYLKEVRQDDVDWNEFTMGRTDREFDPNLYSGWYGYREFSDGPVPGFGSHYIDLVHYITGAQYPSSSVCQGGVFTWKDQYHFTCPDHVQASWIYPEGFMASYSSNFGNGSGNTFKIFGDCGVLDLIDWDVPVLKDDGAASGKGCAAESKAVEPVLRPDHFLNWLQCIRSREVPHAPIEAGHQHAVAVIMAMMAYDAGARMVYDPANRTIRQG